MYYKTFLTEALCAKSIQSCPTLCNSIDGSPPGSPIPGIRQARTLEWVAISFSNILHFAYSLIFWCTLELFTRFSSCKLFCYEHSCISHSFVWLLAFSVWGHLLGEWSCKESDTTEHGITTKWLMMLSIFSTFWNCWPFIHFQRNVYLSSSFVSIWIVCLFVVELQEFSIYSEF